MDRIVPHHFSATREGSDSIRLDGWNEDGTGEGPTIALTNASALDLLARVAVALQKAADESLSNSASARITRAFVNGCSRSDTGEHRADASGHCIFCNTALPS